MRSLSPDEAALWAKVAETIRPLSREQQPPAELQAETLAPAKRAGRVPPQRPQAGLPLSRPKLGATLDGTWDRKLRSGKVTPDRTLDLHGMSLDRAWAAIDRLLDDAIADSDRVLLLVTGHAPKGAPPVQRGKIRAAVGDWLAASRHAPRIASVRNAHLRHGGSGALYIILRRG